MVHGFVSIFSFSVAESSLTYIFYLEQYLYFSRSPPSTQSSLPFSISFQPSRDSSLSFNDRIKIRENRTSDNSLNEFLLVIVKFKGNFISVSLTLKHFNRAFGKTLRELLLPCVKFSAMTTTSYQVYFVISTLFSPSTEPLCPKLQKNSFIFQTSSISSICKYFLVAYDLTSEIQFPISRKNG